MEKIMNYMKLFVIAAMVLTSGNAWGAWTWTGEAHSNPSNDFYVYNAGQNQWLGHDNNLVPVTYASPLKADLYNCDTYKYSIWSGKQSLFTSISGTRYYLRSNKGSSSLQTSTDNETTQMEWSTQSSSYANSYKIVCKNESRPMQVSGEGQQLSFPKDGNKTSGNYNTWLYISKAQMDTYNNRFFYFQANPIAGEGGSVTPQGKLTYELANYADRNNTHSQTLTFSATADEANGYQFEGWYESEDFTGERVSGNNPYTPVINNSTAGSTVTVTLYAHFVRDYTPEIALNGGYDAMKVDDIVPLAEMFTLTHVPSPVYTLENNNNILELNGGNLIALNAGSATIVVTQNAEPGYKYAQQKFTITVSKFANPITVNGSAEYATVLTYNDQLPLTIVSANPANTIVVTQNTGEDIMRYEGNQLISNYRDGAATWTITQAENYKYLAGSATILATVQKATEAECYIYESAPNWEPTCNDFGEQSFPGPGYAKTLYYKGKFQTASINPKITPYQLVDGEWQALPIAENLATSFVPQEVEMNANATAIKFVGGGTLSKYVTDVKVSRKTFVRASVFTLTLPQKTPAAANSQATFDVSWSRCDGGEISIVSDDSHFAVSPSAIPDGDAQGTQTITVTYTSAEEGTHNGNIIITNRTNKVVVPVSATTVGKIATNIVWEGKGAGEYYSTADGEVANPFRVYDANGDLVEDAVITIASSNSYVASVSDDGKTSFTPYCGGEVTLSASYAGNEKYLPSNANQTIQVALCEGMLVWDQNLMAFTDQDIDKPSGTIAMNAVLKDEHGTEITGVTYTYSVDDTNVATVSGNTLTIVGVGETRVNVTTSEVVYNNKTYQSLTSSLIVRVREDGADCESFFVSRPGEVSFEGNTDFYSVEWENPTRDLIDPDINFSFDVKTTWGANRGDGLTIYYKSPEYAEWTRLGSNIKSSLSDSYTTIADRSLPANATGIQFRYTGTGWGKCTIKNLNIRQKTYFTASVSSITELAEVNADFNAGFSLRYSDVPAIRYELRNVSTSDGLPHGLTITPAADDIINSCGDYGTIDFHIYGRWNRARTITANLAIWTSADPENPIVIPVSITVKAGATYTFNNHAGDNLWTTAANWYDGGSYTHGQVPGAGNPVIINAPIIITDTVHAYSVNVNNDGTYNTGDITIASTGGLTVHNGGIICPRNIVIQLDKNGSGYFRMSPEARVETGSGSQVAIMPNATVEYTTRSTLSTGANKDATWQYFGVPFASSFTVDYNTWLYLWDEQSDWVSLRDQSQPVSLQPWKGYAITQYGQPTYSFSGKMLGGPLDSTATITFTKTGGELTSGMNGDNLWANSYCSPIDVKNFTAADFSSVEASDIDLTFYIFNSGSWNQWDGVKDASGASPGQYTSIPVLSAGDLGSEAQTLIAPMQGVYTHVNNNGVTMTLDYAKHVWNAHATKAQMTAPMRVAGRVAEDTDSLMNESDSLAVDSASLFRRVRMAVSSNNSGADHLYLLERPAYTAAYDNGYDALKIFAETPGSVGIYTSEQGGQMAVSATGNMDSLFVGVQAGDDTEYRLQISAVVGDSLYLKDMQTNTLIPLVDGATYAFVMNAKSNDEKRFLVVDGYRHMVYSPVATGIGEHLVQPAPVVNKFMRQGQLFILRDGVLYDAVGRKVK